MYEKINYTLVGIFVIISTALLVLFGFWLAKEGSSSKNFNSYYCYFNESVDGLNIDSVVKLNGVNVGRLKELAIDNKKPSLIKATLNISKKIRITKDMYAILKNQGLTGLRYIDIIGGKSSEIIEPNSSNSIISTKQSLISKLSITTPQLIDKMADFTKRLDKTFSDKNIENIEKIISNSKEITNEAIKLEKNINSIITDINRTSFKTVVNIISDLNTTLVSTLIEYKKLAKNGNLTLKTINKKLPKLLNNLDKSSNELRRVARLIRVSINRGDYNLRKILRPAIIDLKELSISYKELSDELKSIAQDPSNAIFNGTTRPKGPGE